MPAPTPQSNVEKYLSVVAGHGGEIPSEPSSRVEYFLNEIVEGGGIGGKLKPKIVSSLPQIGETGLLYLVPAQGSSGQNAYNEYIWIEEETKFELLGQTKIDFDPSGFVPDTRKVGNVPLSADIPVTLTGDTMITVTNTGTASAIGYSIAHEDSGVTAGSKGDTTNQTPGFGGTFKALSATVDAKGHVTSFGDHTVKVPNATATSQADGLMSKSDKAKLDAIGVTASAPLEVTKTGETYNVTLKDSGVTAGSKGDTTNQTPGFGGTFKALSATVDAKGRITSLAEHSVKVPDTEATQSAKGLMSAADKTKLDTLIDATLSNSGNAADAKATGDAISLLRNYLQSMEVYRTASGNPATFDDGYAANLKDLTVTLTPAQAGTGDPYPPGGGKNLFNVNPTNMANLSVDNGVVTLTSRVSSETYRGMGSVTLSPGSYIISGGYSAGFRIYIQTGGEVYVSNGGDSNVLTVETATTYGMGCTIGPNISEGSQIKPMIRHASETDATFAPYSNIRPISGVSSVTVTRTGESGANPQSVTVTLTDGTNPLTVYGGTLDVTTGTLSVTYGEYQSYNGETLPGVWISDRDVYAPGTTPTIGAQVVYALATPRVYYLIPEQIAALPGYNAVLTDAGTLSVTYRADPALTLGDDV